MKKQNIHFNKFKIKGTQLYNCKLKHISYNDKHLLYMIHYINM